MTYVTCTPTAIVQESNNALNYRNVITKTGNAVVRRVSNHSTQTLRYGYHCTCAHLYACVPRAIDDVREESCCVAQVLADSKTYLKKSFSFPTTFYNSLSLSFQLHRSNTIHMRFPSLPTFIRTLYAFSNSTLRSTPATFAPAFRNSTALRASMPTIPFLGSLFHTAESRKMSYPGDKSDSEWQAQLNPGKSTSPPT